MRPALEARADVPHAILESIRQAHPDAGKYMADAAIKLICGLCRSGDDADNRVLVHAVDLFMFGEHAQLDSLRRVYDADSIASLDMQPVDETFDFWSARFCSKRPRLSSRI